MKNVPKLRFKANDGSEFPEWEEKKLGNIAQIYDGVHQTPEYLACGVRFVSVENINNLYSSNKFISQDAFKRDYKSNKPRKSDILMTRIGDIGSVAMVTKDDDLAFYVSLALIRTSSIINPNFLFYEIQSDEFKNELWKNTLHTAYPKKINKQDIGKCQVYFPKSLLEQQKIASFLSTIDEIIAKSRAEIDAWEKRKKGVVKKLFSQEVRFKADDGSEFPEWKEKRLGDSIQFLNGRAYRQDELLESGRYIVLRVGNLFTNDNYYYSDLELDEDKYIEDGNLIYAWSATFGPRIYRGKKCIYHYHIWKLNFNENIISKMFLYYYLQYDVEKIKTQRTGGTMVHVTKSTMENRALIFPSLPEQQKIADCLSSIDEVIKKCKKELAAWEELKKGLLQQMFV